MTDLDLDKLEAGAKAADVGVAWHLENGAKRGESVIAMQGNSHHGVFVVEMVAERIFNESAAQHIVDMNPATTLALIERLRAAEESHREIRAMHAKVKEYGREFCNRCGSLWPCETIEALGEES